MIMKARTSEGRTWRMAAFAATAVLGLAGVAAIAQPAGGTGHGPGHGPGHPGGMEVEQILGSVKGQLNLNTSQQLMWDNAVAQTRAAHAAGRANMQKVHDATAAELAKPEPDLAAVAAVADGVHAGNQALRQGVRDQWLQLYATFTADQKAVVRDALAKQLARMEAIGAKMREHMQQGG
jgi:Spy/CpxP family protein refolding chaperone